MTYFSCLWSLTLCILYWRSLNRYRVFMIMPCIHKNTTTINGESDCFELAILYFILKLLVQFPSVESFCNTVKPLGRHILIKWTPPLRDTNLCPGKTITGSILFLVPRVSHFTSNRPFYRYSSRIDFAPWASHSTHWNLFILLQWWCSIITIIESIQYYGMSRGQNQYGCCIGKKVYFSAIAVKVFYSLKLSTCWGKVKHPGGPYQSLTAGTASPGLCQRVLRQTQALSSRKLA